MKIAVLVLGSVLLAGCGSGASDKAGGSTPIKATVLTFANGNGDSESLRPFAQAVARLSGGTLRIEFKDGWRAGDPAYETGVIRDVQAGKASLGWAGTRAFDDVGVASFDALHAPLLIDSYPLEGKVLASGLVPGMLEGLKPLDVVGLGILPGPMRKPLGVSPLARPEDYRGAHIAMQRSQVAAQTLRALGARGTDRPAGASITGYDGVEQQVSSMAVNDYDQVATYLTANVNLWARPAVVFINPKAFAALGDDQRRALRGAARAALPATLDYERTFGEEGAASLCRRRVSFITATAADLGLLQRAIAPVYARLERDVQTKAAIARIRSLRSELAALPDAPVCNSGAARPAAGAGTSVIDGVYRSDITMRQLKATPGYAAEDHPGNIGHFRLELRGGHFKVSGSSDHVDQEGDFALKGNVLTFLDWAGEGDFSYRWSLYRGALVLRKLGEGPTIFAVHPWRQRRESAGVGARTPIDGSYTMTSTREEVAKAFGEPAAETLSENYGTWRFVLSRGLMRYTQASEGARRWTKATYTVKGRTFTFRVTDYGGEAPTGSPERTGEVFTFSWSLSRDRLTLKPVKGKVSPANFSVKAWRRSGDAP